MATTTGTISGTLSGTNYGDNEDRTLAAGSYDYALSVSGDGKLAFKVEKRELTKNGSKWVTVEEKSKVRGGAVLNGSFDADSTLDDDSEVRFNFNREVLSNKVSYTLNYDKNS